MKNAKRKSGESGVALLLAIFTLLLLTAVGLALLGAADLETSIAANYRDKQQSIYGGLSGLQEARDRLIPSRCDPLLPTDPCNDVNAIDYRNLALPSTGAPNVIYLVNPASGEKVQPWNPIDPNHPGLNLPNPYFDTELCHEKIPTFPQSTGSCLGISGPVPIGLVPSGTAWFNYDSTYGTTYNDSTSFTPARDYQTGTGTLIPTALPYKWVRITLKADNMTPVLANGAASTGAQMCWNDPNQIPAPGTSGCGATSTLKLFYNGSLCGTTCNFSPAQGSGYSYTSPPTVTIGPPPAGGTTATATAHVITVSGGRVTTISVNPGGGGSGYTSAPTVTLSGGGYSTLATATATFQPPGVPVASFSAVTQQNPVGCYSATPSVAFSGGTGSGAKVTAVMTGKTCIANWTISYTGGTCSTSGTVSVSGTGGGGSGFTGTVTIKGNQKGITSNSITNPGSGYTSPPAISGLSGCTYTSAPVLGYRVASVSLTSGGSGYTVGGPPTVTISAPTQPAGENPPTVTAILGSQPANAGQVTGVTVTGGGAGYTTAPAVVFSAPTGTCTPGPCTVAAATASVTSTGKIDSITLTSAGSGYVPGSSPTVTIGTPGSGATVEAIISPGTAYGNVYLLTALAISPGGSKTMTQMEIATPPPVYVSAVIPGALTIDAPNPTINPGNSNNYVISGVDAYNGGAGCPGTGITSAQPALPSVGVLDDPNNPTSPTAVSCLTSVLGGASNSQPQCASQTNQSGNYSGALASPDVQNVYNTMQGLATPAGADTLATEIASKASYTYPDSTGVIPSCTSQTSCGIYLGSYPGNCPTIVVNGDFTMGPVTGCGILLVTGNLTMQGNYNWSGPVFVIGKGGSFTGGGGGNGIINGSLFVAQTKDSSGNLLATLGKPTVSYNVTGGGGNGIQYDSCKSNAMLNALNLPTTTLASPATPKILSMRSIY
jgi:hypothetical protein